MKKINKYEIDAITLKNPIKAFPSEITKIRPEDLWKRSKNLNKKDETKMIDLSQRLFDKQIGTDYLAVRKGKRVSFRRL